MGQKTLTGGFSTKELIVCALLGAILFFLVFTLGSGIVAATGIPATGGMGGMLVSLIVLTLGRRLVDKFGSATAICLVTGTLAIPTISFGPPGIYKIPLLLTVGLAYDLVFYLLRKNFWREILAGGAVGFVSAPVMYLFISALGLPGAEKLAPLLAFLTVLYTFLGLAGSYIGNWTYENKLKNRAFIKRIRA